MEIVNKLINLKVKIASFFFGLSEYSFIRDELGIIPPLGGLDLSPILAFVVIRVIQGILGNAAALTMGGFQIYG